MIYDVTIKTPDDTLTDYLAYGDTIDGAAADFRQTQGYWLRHFRSYTLTLIEQTASYLAKLSNGAQIVVSGGNARAARANLLTLEKDWLAQWSEPFSITLTKLENGS